MLSLCLFFKFQIQTLWNYRNFVIKLKSFEIRVEITSKLEVYFITILFSIYSVFKVPSSN